MTVYEKIQKTMRENERFVLRRVRRANKAGALFEFWYGHGLGRSDRPLSNALDRLIEKGKVVFIRRRGRWGYGYRLTQARAPKSGWQLTDSFGRIPGERHYQG
jgi:hypothetical protein